MEGKHILSVLVILFIEGVCIVLLMGEYKCNCSDPVIPYENIWQELDMTKLLPSNLETDTICAEYKEAINSIMSYHYEREQLLNKTKCGKNCI
jgi:hypothetical protein